MTGIEGLFGQPGVSFWIHGQGEDETVRIVIRWSDWAAEGLSERFDCLNSPKSIRNAILEGLYELFGPDMRVLDQL